MDDVTRSYETARRLVDLGRFDEAESHLGRALSLAPDDPRLHLLRFEILAATGSTDEAVLAAERAVELEVSATTLHACARANRAADRLDRARELIDAAIERDPERAILHVTAAMIVLDPYLADVTSGTFDSRRLAALEARAAADRAIALSPHMRNGWYARAMASVVDSDLPAAAADLTETLRLDPEWSSAHISMGWVRHRQGMTRLASRHYAAAGRLDPENERALERLRHLGHAQRLTFAGAAPIIGLTSLFLLAFGAGAALIGALILCLGVWAWIRFRPDRSPRIESAGLDPDARAVLENDLRLPEFEVRS